MVPVRAAGTDAHRHATTAGGDAVRAGNGGARAGGRWLLAAERENGWNRFLAETYKKPFRRKKRFAVTSERREGCIVCANASRRLSCSEEHILAFCSVFAPMLSAVQALAAVPLAPPVPLTPSRAPRLSNRTVLHFNHLPKCAGSEMIEVLQKCLPSGQLRVATERESTNSKDQQAGFVVGSIREPCSALVSLWAFGVAGHGRLRAQLVDRGLAGRFYPSDHDPSAELHGAMFREWLAHPARGMFQQRFDDSFPEPWAVDCWVRVESLESDLRRCLHGFEAQGGGPVDWSKAEPVLAQQQRRREAQLVQTGHDRTPSDKCNTKDTKEACHNPSTHDSCGDYFNASAASAVFAEQPGIVNAFGFASCCDGGAASTNTPQFEFPGSPRGSNVRSSKT